MFKLPQKPKSTHKRDVLKSEMSVREEKCRGAVLVTTVTARLICVSVWHIYFWFINGAVRNSEHAVWNNKTISE
jgi:hypothetical protein